MTWEIIYLEEFRQWLLTLTREQRRAVTARLDVLAEEGPALGRPTVDTLRTSRHANMKELRVSSEGALRVLFAFDPKRRAVLLMGGNKSGNWHDWYRTAIPLADDRFDRYLLDMKQTEGDL